MQQYTKLLLCCAVVWGVLPASANAQLERLCDPGAEDCRQILINHIRAERVGLDVAFWFMEDSWIASEVIARKQAGVPVRVLMDTRANASTPRNADRLAELKAAGIPMREKVSSGILHWKMMLFAGQGIVEFSGANFSSDAWVYSGAPYTNYVDEAIYFTSDPKVVNSFRTRFDNLWTDTTRYRNYANITTAPTRTYDTYPQDPELNFPPFESFADRSVQLYNAEREKLDIIIYRITDQRHTNAVIAAVQRGVPVRLITEPQQYRDPKRLWHSWNIDRLYMAGVQIRNRTHQGLNHQKLTLFYSQDISVTGSSNWTSPSDNSQDEHNYFTKKPDLFAWLQDHFDRKWTNGAGVSETGPFTPLPPDAAKTPAPAHGAVQVDPAGVVLKWDAGFWAHKYDIYFGTSPAPPLLASDRMLGPSQSASDYRQFAIPTALAPGTTYYWRIVSKTMADQPATSPVWTFTTSGSAGPAPDPLPAPWSSQDVGAVGVPGSAALSGSTFTVRGSGADIWGTADALHFMSQPVSGDVDVVARVASVENVHAWTKAGVMIRGSLAANSAQAIMLVSPGKGLAFQRRLSTGATSSSTGTAGTAPAWVKLERRGNIIRAYRSTNGTSWTLVGSDTFSLGSTVQVGLAVGSHDNSRLATATFDNVQVTAASGGGGGGGDTQAPTAQITSPSNGATVNGTVNVAAAASDNVGVVSVDILLDGSVVATDTSAPYQFAWNTTGASNGTHTLRARAVDSSSNIGLSPTVTVTVNNTTSTAQEIVLWTADATATAGGWRLVNDSGAAAGLRMYHPDAGGAKITTALASPTHYFEMTFNAVAGKAYRMWVRGKAENNYWANDSVFAQFSNSVNASGSAMWRIGTTSAAEVNLEECNSCGVANWGWQDNGWGSGVLGPLVYFNTTGPVKIRIQTREDGFSIDQIVLSPATYLNSSPGVNKNDTRILGKTQ